MNWRKALTGFLSLVVLCAFAATMYFHRDRLFHGKRESQWITDLSPGDERQVEQWRHFGVEGVRVLVRAFDNPESPAVRLYRNARSKMTAFFPAVLTRGLPAPGTDMSGIVRLKVMLTMSKLEALPALIEAVQNNVGGINAVRALASFPEQAETIAPVLLELMDHRSGRIRLAADWAFNEIEAFRERNTERSSIER